MSEQTFDDVYEAPDASEVASEESAAVDPAGEFGNLDEYPEGLEFDLSDLELDDESAAPVSPGISREAWQASVDFVNRRVAEVERDLGLVEPVNPATGRTEDQDLARADLEVAAWLEQGDPALRNDRHARADAIANELARTYGAGPEVAHAAMQLADQQVVGEANAWGEFESILSEAAKTRGLEDFDVERAMARGAEVFPEILRTHPDIGEVAFGLAALAAVADQDPREEWSITDAWGAAAKLVEHLKESQPPAHEDDGYYTNGGTAAGKFFGRNAKGRLP